MGQRVIALVAYDGADPVDLDDEHREVARRIFGDIERIPDLCRAVLVAVCGARGGKTYILSAMYALWRMVTADLSMVAAGEIAVAAAVAPDKKLARQIKNYVLGACEGNPELAAMIVTRNEDSLTLERADGHLVSLEVLAASRGGAALRGRTLVCAILDESAFFRDQSYRINDVDLFDAVHARVIPGGCTVVDSTPWAEAGLLYQLFTKNHGHPVNAVAAHAPTLLLRDNDPKLVEMIASVRAVDPQKARREYDAEFLSAGAGLFFDPSAVRLCSDERTRLTDEVPGLPGYEAGIGGDLGLVHDASAFVAVHKHGDEVHVAELLEMQPETEPLKLSAVVAAGASMVMRHRRSTLWADQYALEPAREHATKHSLRIEPMPNGQAAKAEAFTRVKQLIHAGLLKVHPQHERLIRQLGEVIAAPTAGGGLKITSPRRDSERGGEHGDLVSALVAAVHALDNTCDARIAAASNDRIAAGPQLSRWGSAPTRGFG